MKIVFLIDQVYRHGGIERVLSIKANYLASNSKNSVYIITSEQNKNKACYHFNSNIIFKDLGVNYHRNLSYFHPKNVLKIPRHIRLVKQTLNKIKPDVVVVCSHSVDTYFVPFINKSIPKVKEFHFSKSIEVPYRKKGAKSKKKYFLYFADYVEKKYNKLIVLNKDEAKYYKSNNIAVIPNPITFYPSQVSQLNKPIAIAAGRIAPVKRFDLLVDIWELIHKKNNNWQLHIYGEGDKNYIDTLQKQINEKQLSKHIILKGKTDNIQDKMLNASVFLMTSDNECFPLVLLEAQACGLPIVSFDCPHGPRNIISDKNGILIPPKKQTKFANAAINIINNETLRKKLGQHARENAANYNEKAIMDKWLTIFNQLIK
ncbi:glycosyltransferase family 4 protein [Seonamhaeicola sp. NFXS20]|uniref:glycosyltransferase family 4 protein n=1 Tax=Seonamhaeicola sp. NFXS20 TaxID=2816959 RepID=UPI003B8CF17F